MKKLLIASSAVLLSVIVLPSVTQSDVPVSTAILREQAPVDCTCLGRRRERLSLKIRARSLATLAAQFRGTTIGGAQYGGYGVGGYEFGGGNICGIDAATGYSTCPPTSYSYSVPTRSYSYNTPVRTYVQESAPSLSYSLPQASVAYSTPLSCEAMIGRILEVLLQELVSVQSRQNDLLLQLLRERSGGAGTYDVPQSPRPSGSLNRS